MGEREITRRQVLAGVAGVGGVGSVLGGGTAALFTDGETFEGSRFQSGVVDLAVEVSDREGSGEGEIEVPLTLEKTRIFKHEESNRSNVADSRGTKEATADSDGTPTPEDPAEDPTPTETPTETDTPEPTSTPVETPTATPEETPTATPEETPTPTPEETPTATLGDERSDNGTGGNGSGVDPSVLGGTGPPDKKHGGDRGKDRGDPPWHKFFVWRDAFEVTVELEDRDGENNAVFGWVGAECPEDDIVADLDVTIQYADGGSDSLLYAGPVAGLAGGIPLDPDGDGTADDGEQRCFEPPDDEDGEGDTVTLEVIVEHEYPDDDIETAFTLEFVGRQCRYDQASNPFPEDPDCGSTLPDPEHEISFVAFCSSADGSSNPRVTAIADENDDGEPLAVEWETDVAVDYVVVKASTLFTIYDYRELDATSGTTMPDDTEADVVSTTPHPQSWASNPCGLAAEEFDEHPTVERSTVKLDSERGDLEVDDQ